MRSASSSTTLTMPSPRPRAIKPQLKDSAKASGSKPRIPSRLSHSALPPLPEPDASAVAPPPLSRSTRSRHSSPAPRRYSPAPRRSSYAPEGALESIGAVYISWGEGKRDPAPLCCPIRKKEMRKRLGEAQVGWMTAQPAPSVPSLPPALSLPIGVITTSSPSAVSQQRINSPPNLLAVALSSSLSSTRSVSPPASSFSPSASNSSHLFLAEAFQPTSLGFNDPTLALPMVDSRPSSPKGTQQPPLPDAMIKVEDDFDAASEGLWSAGEELWSATDVESEASWAW
ncbi:hypothetical protein JCM21900_001945 [Sporobolomyces salmonicolor]